MSLNPKKWANKMILFRTEISNFDKKKFDKKRQPNKFTQNSLTSKIKKVKKTKICRKIQTLLCE